METEYTTNIRIVNLFYENYLTRFTDSSYNFYVMNSTTSTESLITGFPNNNLQSLQEVERVGTLLSDIAFQWPKPDDPIIIMYTSGTTWTPKAAMAIHRNLIKGSAKDILILFELVLPEAYYLIAAIIEVIINLSQIKILIYKSSFYELSSNKNSN